MQKNGHTFENRIILRGVTARQKGAGIKNTLYIKFNFHLKSMTKNPFKNDNPKFYSVVVSKLRLCPKYSVGKCLIFLHSNLEMKILT